MGMCWKARVTHLKIKVPYNVLLGDTTNANNVSAKKSGVARLDLLGGGRGVITSAARGFRGHAPLQDFELWGL